MCEDASRQVLAPTKQRKISCWPHVEVWIDRTLKYGTRVWQYYRRTILRCESRPSRRFARTPPAFADSLPIIFSHELWWTLGDHWWTQADFAWIHAEFATDWRTVRQKYLQLGIIRAKVRVRVRLRVMVRVRVRGKDNPNPNHNPNSNPNHNPNPNQSKLGFRFRLGWGLGWGLGLTVTITITPTLTLISRSWIHFWRTVRQFAATNSNSRMNNNYRTIQTRTLSDQHDIQY
jgi:hypothetical protein